MSRDLLSPSLKTNPESLVGHHLDTVFLGPPYLDIIILCSVLSLYLKNYFV